MRVRDSADFGCTSQRCGAARRGAARAVRQTSGTAHLENFDDAFFVVARVDALKHLRVLAAADLADDLVVVLFAARRRAQPPTRAHAQRQT